jgi:acyl-CoA reductase-like NAD-dependent aldehyde dehydrogenase
VDALQRVFYYGETVLIKQHPLRPYLEHPYRALLQPLIDDNVLHLVKDEGIPATIAILKDPRVGHVHMTGAEATANAVSKTLASNPTGPGLTSELGCSTPWIMAPGEYTKTELENVRARRASEASEKIVMPRERSSASEAKRPKQRERSSATEAAQPKSSATEEQRDRSSATGAA